MANFVLAYSRCVCYIYIIFAIPLYKETDQASVSKPYLEGTHWIKGDLIGTGAFCSCYLARDVENGTIFAVKEVKHNNRIV